MHKREGEIHVDMECLRWGEAVLVKGKYMYVVWDGYFSTLSILPSFASS